MQTILLVIYLMVVVALIGIVLVQRSEGGGLGIGGGSGFMSARGAANALTRTTAILATLFFLLANLATDMIYGGHADRPEWMTESRTYPLLNATGRAVVDWVETRRTEGDEA